MFCPYFVHEFSVLGFL